MGKYGEAAVRATKFCHDGLASSPKEAWEQAVREIFPKSPSLQQEAGPRCAYLGLCEDGFVYGIPEGNYYHSQKGQKKNKGYTLKVLSLLRQDPSRSINTEQKLWQEVMKGEKKTPHSQMDVVLFLWNADLINKGKL
ncbi:MAG: hypothetical protein ABSG91_17055 [Syntrophobacteraceae bacterium]|jgi:hypothetical protein